MTETAHSDPRPYLSVVAWPGGFERDEVARLLAEAGVLDLPTLRMRLGQDPPMVLAQIEAATADRAVETLIGRGGDGFAFTLDDLAALGPTLRLKDLRVVEGGLDVDLWYGLGTTLALKDLQILIRAHLHRSVTKRREPPRLTSMHRRHRTWDSVKAEIEASVTKEVETSDKLDIHTADGSVYQIDGDKFSYTALGDLRGHADKANMDSMLELLGHLAPDAVVDGYFTLWRPPPGHERLRVPDARTNKDDPAFAFYSRWSALTYRHVMGA